jgi:flagellar basal-body rod protein FlgB
MSDVPKLLEKVLDYSALKQKLISKNIANLSTVNYKREDISFDEYLNKNVNGKLKVDNSKHFSTGEVKMPGQPDFNIEEDKSEEKISGMNNVDIDREMAEMAQNTLLFKFSARRLNFYYRNLQSVIKGGR